MSSLEEFHNALSSFPPSPERIDAMDTSSDSDSEPVFDGTNSSLRRRLTLETKAYTHDLLEQEDELLDSESTLPTPGSSRELSELFTQDVPSGNLSIPFASTLIYPRSQYDGYVSPLPICEEKVALEELLHLIEEDESQTTENIASGDNHDDSFVQLDLTEFAIYLPPNRSYPYELRGLQEIGSKASCSSMLFDGLLCAGSHRRYVQRVPFEICSIGNYGQQSHTVGGDIWIQTEASMKSDVSYRLKMPSPEYRRYHDDFVWLADLAKHFVDYSEACEEDGKAVSIHNFRKDFSQWLLSSHRDSVDFQKWYDKYQGHDFRPAISVNIDFLFKESMGVLTDNFGFRNQPIWSELQDKNFVPAQKVVQSKTVVTPYVYDCFGHLRFGQYLQPVALVETVRNQQSGQGHSLNLTVASNFVVEISSQSQLTRPSLSPSRSSMNGPTPDEFAIKRRKRIKAIKVGDVLSVPTEKDGLWKDEGGRWKAPDDCWYLYVQVVHTMKNGQRAFDGIWLYRPSDTSCAKMKYPYSNELFLSDNCTCEDSKYTENEVIDVVAVAWHGQPSTCNGLFIRQTVLENERFVTLKDIHKKCKHFKSEKGATRYPIGQTVLVGQIKLSPPQRSSKYDLDPYEIVGYYESNSKDFATIRKLLRRNEMAGQSLRAPNELVYSNEMFKVETRRIERTCLVRFYREADVDDKTIPAPYNRNGTGNAFYITSKIVEGQLTPFGTEVPEDLIQGYDPYQEPSRKKLRGLDLYCGGGNFGRGLEEGQAVHNKWAVDMDKIAIHTYYANLQKAEDTNLYFGSVNDLLLQALQGNPEKSQLIPRPGEVDFMSAGSPCQGFSRLNNLKDQEKGLRNQSMVASVAAYIDLYRPKYGLLENVVAMGQKGKKRDDDVCSQLICAIVGMGYQLSTFFIDAWNFGSPQSRSRIFVAFAAPGYEPIDYPELSHSHPSKTQNRSIGELANGEPFGERRFGPTPLKFLTAREATRDLPSVADGATHTCIPYPEHIMHYRVMKDLRLQIAAIPKYPRGMNFWKAWNNGKGVMTKAERELFPPAMTATGKPKENVGEKSKAWGRVDPDRPLATIVVTSKICDARMGKFIHWDQNRPMTVLEARRAQSFPDNEVIIGSGHERMKIIGNSVDRSVSLALGLALREAWERNPEDNVQKTKPPPNMATPALLKDGRGRFSSWNDKTPDPRPTSQLKTKPGPYLHANAGSNNPLKRPYALLASDMIATEKSLKAAKISTAMDVDDRNELNDTDDTYDTDDTTFRGFSSSEDEEASNEGPKIRIEMDEEGVPVSPSYTAKDGRTITTSTRGKRKSPTNARPKPQFVIDLTSDDAEGDKGPSRPPAKLTVQPAVVLPNAK